MNELLEFALDLSRAAGEAVMPFFRGELQVELKADATPVTQADRRAEEVMRGLIEKRYPDHEILGEEYGGERAPARASHRWILDPIDGTVSFMNGVPLFSTLIGLEVEGRPTIGVMRFPALDETLWAARGEGAFFDGKPARVRPCPRIEDAIVVVTGLHGTDVLGPRVEGRPWVSLTPLVRRAKAFRGWSDAYGHACVATGRADAMIDPEMAPWDTAAIVPIMEEAGGRATALDGKSEGVVYAGSLVSTAGTIHDEVLGLLGGGGGGS